MKKNKKKYIYNKIIILGSGPAGYTAGIYLARANLSPIIITGNNPGGQLTNTNTIENWPGDYNTLTGLEFVERLKKHAIKFNTKIIHDQIIKVNLKKKPFKLIGENKKYQAHAIIIATGSTPRYLGLKSESKFLGKGISTCAICDGFFYKEKIIAIVGGGNTALEECLYLSNIVKKIHLIHRKKYFTAEKILIKKIYQKIEQKKIVFHKNSVIKKIIGEKNKIKYLIIESVIKKQILKIEISGLFIAIGNTPNTQIFSNKIKMKNGYIVVSKNSQKYSSQTNIPGIFAAGDIIYNTYKQAVIAASSGCISALDAEKYLESQEKQISSKK
ncbi:thioredoxin-disulfide reductase [Buchnera aphidicola]|uniref:thioredoxin-disulfide reductase n=1 Tax=Buchnera aphidicola TaxID=9 RepID=UPI002092D0E5|nr:thioredoxin-disulfide reductase [Buchnera aphidicola]USS94335.1 thioredoxin-disulfide reductase [Buchnera aphidicola (Sipha maydis)]WII23494.1 thioredoxin-disulfide reductase [Buchnera aphidicola (Sipha maydis)]